MNMNFNAKTHPAPPEGRVTRVPKFSEKIFGARVTRPSERGVALVITLILLSVITFLAIAFLALSRRERGSVTTTTHMTEAKFAADGALDRAKAEIISTILAFTNEFAFGLAVSTNYVNANGFNPNQPPTEVWPTNVNYEHLQSGALLNFGQLEQNIANLFYNPRPPVFIPNPTNRNLRDFRFYLDLNRNGRYDTNGLQPVLDDLGKPVLDANNNIVSNFFVGDPEWIGGLDRPDFPHSPSNRFTHRYAYLVVPAGKTLDVNFIHNQAKRLGINQEGYFRNQGVGTFEINFAAFLADLNTNYWNNPQANPYNYAINAAGLPDPTISSRGAAFEDAFSFLNHRYGSGGYNDLKNPIPLVDNPAIDEFANGSPVMTTNTPTNDLNDKGVGYSGADNTNHYFTTQDFFDPNKTSPLFTNHLLSAVNGISSYDRNTFSRLVEQLGTDSAPENRMNLNYRNIRNGVVVPGMETNFASWTPLEFFTNAAERLLRNSFPFGVTNIPIYDSTNLTIGYTPAIHRLLQLAANLYDSTTNRSETLYPHLPSVFRPVFSPLTTEGAAKKVYITGFLEEIDAITLWGRPQLNLSDVVQGTVSLNNNDLIKGIPLVIGAKKGFPNFNEFASVNLVRVSRTLQFRKAVADGPITQTNQQYLVGISNKFGVEFWNSYYRSNFSRPLNLRLSHEVSVVITNQIGAVLYSNYFSFAPPPADLRSYTPANPWPAAPSKSRQNPYHHGSFFLPFSDGTNFALMRLTNATTAGLSSAAFVYPVSAGVPQLHLVTKNHLRAMLIDSSAGQSRIVDYVDLAGMDFYLDIASALVGNTGVSTDPSVIGQMFKTNTLANGVNEGINTQIEAGKKNIEIPTSMWDNYNFSTGDKAKGIDAFRVFFGLSPISSPRSTIHPTNVIQAPFNPTRQIVQTTSWQANDPLVHYFVGDLIDLTRTNNVNYAPPKTTPTLQQYGASLGDINTRYKPWGGRPGGLGDSVPDVQTDHAIALKDPLVRTSDDWDFPANKYPNVGWMGRVHRGTPWQTVYLKSTNIWNLDNGATWLKWTGDGLSQNNWDGKGNSVPDAQYTAPTNDWKIFDLFTAAPNDNAGRGQLSVNQNGLAAWSAVLSGVVALTNDSSLSPVQLLPQIIEPAGIYDPLNPGTLPPLVKIVDGINRARANTVPAAGPVFPNQQFSHIGDILAAPELTVNSPFLDTVNLASLSAGGLNDAVIERIPQQIFGLLRKGDQRFVIYAYGQSLRPADNSVLTYSTFRGMCTNYQIMAEVAARAVVRMDIKRDRNGQITGANTVVESYNLLPPD